MFQKILDFLFFPFKQLQAHQKLKKRLKELRDKDPFIYK